MSTPFQVSGTLSLPGTPGLPFDALPFGFASQYDSKAEFELVLTGTGTRTVPFGTVPATGAKCLVLVYEAFTLVAGDPPQPSISVTINAATPALEVSPGGFLVFGSPAPSTGLVSLSVAHTGAGRVRVWLLG